MSETPQDSVVPDPKPYPTAAVGEKEIAYLRKRQLGSIARRAGKPLDEIQMLREFFKMNGNRMEIIYTVKAE